MTINLNVSSLKKFFKNHIAIALWLGIGTVVCAEFFVVKGALEKVQRVREVPANLQTGIVRVNVNQYDALENVLQENSAFEPSETTNDDPFGLAPAK